MRGATMSLTAAASGFVVFLLSVSVIQGEDDYKVTYTSTQICAVKGSTVEIRCSYTYPSTLNGMDNKVVKTFWFTDINNVGVAKRTDLERTHSGRVHDHCDEHYCTLTITDLRESDSAVYYFRFITDQNKFFGNPGVTLSVTDAPKLPSVSVSPSGEIVEGSSVTLTCSSDANPAATYFWYKEEQSLKYLMDRYGPQLVLGSIQSSQSGEYSCAASNKLGRWTSENIFINVKYAPQLPSVSVSPSGEIVEGSSVTLSCSSDANPAAKYTWYKKNQTLLQGAEGSYHFTSISSEDRGIYYCKSENKYGRIISSPLSVDVQYAPKLPSVSVSPSAEIVEGSSMTLSCSSDANPAAKYTWYKENEDSPKASGQIFSITDFRAEHSGIYYCVAQNRRGRRNNTLHLTVVADLHFSGGVAAAAVVVPVVLLVVISLCVFLWRREKKTSGEERPNNGEQCVPDQGQPEEQGELQYASVHFSNIQADPLYSNMRPAQPLRHTEQQEVVEYAAVKFSSAITAPRARGQETGEDPAALYSTVNKT